MSQPSDDDDPERGGTPRGTGPDPQLLQAILQLVELVARLVLALNGDGPGW